MRALIATVAVVFGGGCVAANEEDQVDAIQGAVDVVTDLIEERFPEARDVPRTWSMAINDRGSYWEVRFLPRRADVFGGGPVFHLEKGSLKVLEAYLEQ